MLLLIRLSMIEVQSCNFHVHVYNFVMPEAGFITVNLGGLKIVSGS